jgi:hypothetical protein
MTDYGQGGRDVASSDRVRFGSPGRGGQGMACQGWAVEICLGEPWIGDARQAVFWQSRLVLFRLPRKGQRNASRSRSGSARHVRARLGRLHRSKRHVPWFGRVAQTGSGLSWRPRPTRNKAVGIRRPSVKRGLSRPGGRDEAGWGAFCSVLVGLSSQSSGAQRASLRFSHIKFMRSLNDR